MHMYAHIYTTCIPSKDIGFGLGTHARFMCLSVLMFQTGCIHITILCHTMLHTFDSLCMYVCVCIYTVHIHT